MNEVEARTSFTCTGNPDPSMNSVVVASSRMAETDLVDEFLTCSCCVEQSRLRPDIVWFGEMPMHMEDIYTAVDACEVFIVWEFRPRLSCG